MKVLSCGAGMQSTALALMAIENALFAHLHPGEPLPWPLVPIYDLIVFCDLGAEMPWVYAQVDFIAKACRKADIPFVVIYTGLYELYMERFGTARVPDIPFWTIGENDKGAKMRRRCTIDSKIVAIQTYIRRELLKYDYGEHTRPGDIGKHEMHLGFSAEESRRAFESQNNMYKNKYPLIEMKVERKDNYKYILETWGLNTRASACIMCPYHSNFFFAFVKRNHPRLYAMLLAFDRMLEVRQPMSKIHSRLFITRSRKRIKDLCPGECLLPEKETFPYRNHRIWNGF